MTITTKLINVKSNNNRYIKKYKLIDLNGYCDDNITKNYNVYYDVHFRNSYSDPYWNRGYYYGVNHYVDTPRYVYVKPKKKRSGEYRRGGNKGGGNKGGGKSRGGRRATRRE